MLNHQPAWRQSPAPHYMAAAHRLHTHCWVQHAQSEMPELCLILLQALVVLLLPLLFCLLGDTAELYFSPIMTQVSQSIPWMKPRFAGGEHADAQGQCAAGHVPGVCMLQTATPGQA
jgi:hypothetical protein